MNTQDRLKRDDVQQEHTWDLRALFESDDAWSIRLESAKRSIEFVASYEGKLCQSASILFECLTHYEALYTDMVQLGTYANLKQSEDGTNPKNQERSMLFAGFASQASASIAFIASEINQLSSDAYQALFVEHPPLAQYKLHLDDMYALKSHQLHPETEKTLAALGELVNAPYRIYSVSKAADMTFDAFEDANHTTLPNSFALFETKYEFSKDKDVRRNGYKAFSKGLKAYENTYAAVYSSEIRKQVALSRLRNYPSVTDMLLQPHKVTQDMYQLQIDYIFKNLSPHMQRLAKLKKSILGLEDFYFCDLKAPLDPDFNPPASLTDIKDTLIDALSILGEDYKHIIKTAFEARWIDFADNIGKSTGAFCASPYGAHPYILITYQDNMRSAFTLAHELGHAGHFALANAHQRIFDTRPSTYFVEAPSTINEMLLAQYLMKKDDQPRMKRWVIMQLLETYYHNFVTHLLEAEFQRRVYDMAEKNIPLTAKSLTGTKHSVLKEFWGDAVTIDDLAGLTWMRQPHYYMGLYPYTYSAGLSAATAISKLIADEGTPAVERWLDVLKSGGSLPPKDLLLKAGIDMSTTKPIEVAVEYVGALITELEALFE